jgi:hypothetical protein
MGSALLAPVRPKPSLRAQSNLHFLVDVVDGDMFLRVLNANTCLYVINSPRGSYMIIVNDDRPMAA